MTDENTEIVTLASDFAEDTVDAKKYPLPSDKPMGYTWGQVDHLEIGPKGVLLVPKGFTGVSPYAYPSPEAKSQEIINRLMKEIEELKKKKKEDEDKYPKIEKEKADLQAKYDELQKEYAEYKEKIENAEKEKLLSEVQAKAKEMGIENFEEKIKDATLEKLKTMKETMETMPEPKTKDFGKGEVTTTSKIAEDELLKMAGL